MPLWKKKAKVTTERHVGDFGTLEIRMTERPGESSSADVELSMSPQYALGLEFKQKLEELGLQHPETLRALHVYAVAVGEVPERRDQAVEHLEWLVAAYADDQENKLLALNDLTRLLQEDGELTRAQRWLREALAGWGELRGRDAAETLSVASNLARTLLDLGADAEAEALVRDTVVRRTRVLGAVHPDTLSSRNTLAGTLRGSPARLAEAEHICREILDDLEVGAELSPVVQNNLAAVLVHQGKHAAALEMYRDLIAARTQQQGYDHRDTWLARHNYAVVLNSLGRVTEAETQLAEVFEGYRRTFGPRHAATLEVQVDLAAMKANRGCNTEAIPLLHDAIEGLRITHGPDHPLIDNLADILAQLDR